MFVYTSEVLAKKVVNSVIDVLAQGLVISLKSAISVGGLPQVCVFETGLKPAWSPGVSRG